MTKELKNMLKELGDNHKLGVEWYWKFKNEIELSLHIAERTGYEECSEERLKQLDEVFTKANLDGFKEACETIEKAIRISDKQNER